MNCTHWVAACIELSRQSYEPLFQFDKLTLFGAGIIVPDFLGSAFNTELLYLMCVPVEVTNLSTQEGDIVTDKCLCC